MIATVFIFPGVFHVKNISIQINNENVSVSTENVEGISTEINPFNRTKKTSLWC